MEIEMKLNRGWIPCLIEIAVERLVIKKKGGIMPVGGRCKDQGQ